MSPNILRIESFARFSPRGIFEDEKQEIVLDGIEEIEIRSGGILYKPFNYDSYDTFTIFANVFRMKI
jgi:hypothetical protein